MNRKERLRNMLDSIIDGNEEQAKTEFHSYFAEKTREKVNEDIGSNDPNGGDPEHEDYESRNYRQVVEAVAGHFNIEPGEIDNQGKSKKKKIYDMINKCWDEKNNNVSDACPIDIKIK